MYVRARYAVRMLVVGGGYGCIRLTMDLHAHEIENIKRFLRNLKHKDPDLHARTRLLKLEYFEDEAISQRVDLTPTTSYPPPPGKDDSAPPRLDTTADLHVFITNQLNRLEGLLNRCERRGADLLIQFKNTLRQLLPSLVPGAVKELFDEDAWRYLRHLGDRIRALPCDVAKNAASVGEMILAAVEKAKELKYPSHP